MIFRLLLCFLLFSNLLLEAQLSYSLSNKFWRLKYARIGDREYSFNSSNDNAPTLQFSGANIRGNGGCNAYHTRFTIDGVNMSVNSIMSTRMACENMYLEERTYFDALAQSQTIVYTEGSSDLKLYNSRGDQLVYFAQFSRSSESSIPPLQRTYEREREYTPRRSHRSAEYAPVVESMSKKELRRQKDLEKKKKRGKLTKQEKSELAGLHKKNNQISRAKLLNKKARKGRLSRREKAELKSLRAKSKKSHKQKKSRSNSKNKSSIKKGNKLKNKKTRRR